MKQIKTAVLGILTVLLLGSFNIASACTDFRIIAKDNTVLITRSLEFGEAFNSNLRSTTEGTAFQTTTPNGTSGAAWTSKYGYLYLDGMNINAVVDGMNEQGLSFEDLYMPGETQYQTIESGKDAQAVSYLNFGDWVLGNFKTVDEVRQALANIQVFAQTVPGMGSFIFPLHAAITDASGKGIIVEFVKGKMNIYDNKLGVMTNSPTYDWQMTNLRNFINLAPTMPNPVEVSGITFVATGQGAGMVGLPGDISPPSRFVKTTMMVKTVLPANNAVDALNLAQHIINNVDIPLGFVREGKDPNHYTNETTQWVVFKDLTNKIFYYRTYNDLGLRAVNLAKVNFAKGAAKLKMPIAASQAIDDVTAQFLNNKS